MEGKEMSADEFLACMLTAALSVMYTGFLARTGAPLFFAACAAVAATIITAWVLLNLAR